MSKPAVAVNLLKASPLILSPAQRRAERKSQHRFQQQRVIVVAGQQADGNVEMTIQKTSQADITAPAPVLAENTADQHQIRTFALPLLQGPFEQRKVRAFRTRAASAATR